jgi:hypothetical protein
MSEYIKIVVSFLNGTEEILYCSKRFFLYTLELKGREWEEKKIIPIKFDAAEYNDEVISECIKIREKDFPIDKAKENLPNYDE